MTSLIARADSLWSRVIRKRDPVCRRCGCRRSEEAHHVFSRRNFATRYDIRNGVGVCSECHDDIGDMTRDEKRAAHIGMVGDLYYEVLPISQQVIKKANLPFKEIIRDLRWRLEP